MRPRGAFADRQPLGAFQGEKEESGGQETHKRRERQQRGSPSGAEHRADSVADPQVAKATGRGRHAAGGSWERRKKMEEEEEEGGRRGEKKHFFPHLGKERLKVGRRNQF